MTKSQFKKKQARLFNLRRAETQAYEMDRTLFPKPRTRSISGRNKKSVVREGHLLLMLALGWNSL